MLSHLSTKASNSQFFLLQSRFNCTVYVWSLAVNSGKVSLFFVAAVLTSVINWNKTSICVFFTLSYCAPSPAATAKLKGTGLPARQRKKFLRILFFFAQCLLINLAAGNPASQELAQLRDNQRSEWIRVFSLSVVFSYVTRLRQRRNERACSGVTLWQRWEATDDTSPTDRPRKFVIFCRTERKLASWGIEISRRKFLLSLYFFTVDSGGSMRILLVIYL